MTVLGMGSLVAGVGTRLLLDSLARQISGRLLPVRAPLAWPGCRVLEDGRRTLEVCLMSLRVRWGSRVGARVRLLLGSLVHRARLRPPRVHLARLGCRLRQGSGRRGSVSWSWITLGQVAASACRLRRGLRCALSVVPRSWKTWKIGSGLLWWPMWVEPGRQLLASKLRRRSQ